MIKKIKNLKILQTEKTKQLQLSESLSLKGKLISSTDWTQLLDSNLRDYSVLDFKIWRNSVKEIKIENILNKNKIHQSLLELQKDKPIPDFKYSTDDLNKFKNDLKLDIVKYIEKRMDDFYSYYGFKDFINLKIEESLNYRSKKYPPNDSFRYNFIFQEANLTNKIVDEIVDKYLKIYVELNNLKLKLDKINTTFFEKIYNCATFEDCDRMLEEIKKMYGYRY